jgi:hypothetical protein
MIACPCFVEETKGRSLEEIEESLKDDATQAA